MTDQWGECPHRSNEDRPRCNHPKRLPLPVVPSMCAACPHVRPRLPKAERFAVLPCTHRGAELRQEKCRMGCASETRTVAVHACAVRGECSVSRISRGQSLPLCTDCELRQP